MDCPFFRVSRQALGVVGVLEAERAKLDAVGNADRRGRAAVAALLAGHASIAIAPRAVPSVPVAAGADEHQGARGMRRYVHDTECSLSLTRRQAACLCRSRELHRTDVSTLTVASKMLHDATTPRVTITELADRLGVSRQAVAAWAAGRTRPDPKHWKAIEEATGIPSTSWLEETTNGAGA